MIISLILPFPLVQNVLVILFPKLSAATDTINSSDNQMGKYRYPHASFPYYMQVFSQMPP